MQDNLIKTLIIRGLITEGTLVEGKVKVVGLGHMPQMTTMELMIVSNTSKSFKCRDRLGRPYVMDYSNVTSLDGMDLARFASVYNIKADGSSKAQGKKRGRKPKSAQINTVEGELHGKDKRTEDHHQAEPACA